MMGSVRPAAGRGRPWLILISTWRRLPPPGSARRPSS